MKPAIETLVYHIRKKKLIYFGQKIELVYENCEILRYKVGRMEEYLRIERVSTSCTREEEKEEEKKILRGIYSSQILRRISHALLFARKVLAIL